MRWLALLAALALLGGLACGGGLEEAGFSVVDEVEAGRFTLAPCDRYGEDLPLVLAFDSEVKLSVIEVDSERRRAVVTAGGLCWRGRVPRDGALWTVAVQRAPALRPALAHRPARPLRPLAVQVEVEQGGRREVVAVARRSDGGWIDLAADLSAWAGKEVRLRVATQPDGVPGARSREGESEFFEQLAWSSAGLSRARSVDSTTTARPPNIVFVVVDTLRADRTTPYGYQRPTTPELTRWLADRGVVLEEAYSQAPWTLPSMVSMMTGRYPGELLRDSDPASYGVPAAVPTLAESLAELGYETAAFYANFALRDSNGFGRGLATRYTPSAGGRSNFLHAESVNRRALPWIAAHQHQKRPFFLYLHYLDPHDPYDNPDLVDGRTDFDPDYAGSLTGMDVHAVYVGNREIRGAEDVAHLSALYDSEIRYVDRHLGELLASFDPHVVANTLFVFTSDHGEELFDHGGWKHGYTLYDEQIHVPLIFRWDGHLPAGSRLTGTVELLDLLPTLAAAVGLEEDPSWQGINLLPALRGERAIPRRVAFAQHLISGPLRAAAVLDRTKLILFNRAEPFAPQDRLIERFWRQDVERMERRELYDLAADPGERSNRAGDKPALAGALERVINERLDRVLPGLRLMVSGLPSGSRLNGRLVFTDSAQAGPSPADPAQPGSPRWHPYFLADGDRVELTGSVLSFEFIGEPFEKGLWLTGASAVKSIEVSLDGEPLAAQRILIADGERWRGQVLDARALTAAQRPSATAGPALRLWRREVGSTLAAVLDPEVEESLRALGYIQ